MLKKVLNKIKRRVLSMFKLTKESGIVKNVWVPLILNGTYTFEQCPNLFNLREVVEEVLIEVGFIIKEPTA
ncbi:hypothetical protein KQI88_15995 [Alkaliphilus sp. MSJ-5]|uniref:Uncharacterized protein n=1 Tax=Alkaliphilus flagellatus TaxID=2841507 RepID=A0ABS6G601_9FIRM|nr:hypothetical protein [Alkaliphilus flagellatus]MBU5677920.1 hypothetical protein [Alkaliphilus flagellatus]